MADRELLAVPAGDVEAALGGYAALGGIDEVAVLSTRYRIEIYASTRCPTAALLALSQALTARAGRPLPLVELHGEEAFRHLVRVAASLESAFLGEPEIAAQVKEALRRAVDAGVAGRELTGVLNRALDVADRVRSESAIGGGSSWGPAVAALAEKVLGSLSGRRVAVIGAGNAARASASHLESCGAVVVVLDREIPHGLSLQSDVGAQPRPVQALEDELLRADVVVSAAPASLTAFRPDAMVRAARVRRRPLVLVDLSVPRTIPAETGAVPDVYLCDVDDLHRVMRAATADRAAAVAHAEEIIGEEIARWGRGEAELRTVPIIEEMQTRAAAIARGEVERTLRRLAVDAEIEQRLDAMAESIVSRLLNQPSARLRQAASEGGQGEALLAAAKEIFQLGSESATRRSNFA